MARSENSAWGHEAGVASARVKRHSTARMMCIAAGHEDADDLDALRHDPALLIACNRAPEGGHDIPSQPTISRLENLADVKTLYRIGIGFIDLFCRG